ARIVVRGLAKPDALDERLFKAIPERHTTRKPFNGRRVGDELISQLESAADTHGCWLRLVVDQAERERVADLVAEADRRQLDDPASQHETAAWLRPGVGSTQDGIPAYAQGVGDRFDLVMLVYASAFSPGDAGERVAALDRLRCDYAPVLAVLGTDGDEPI